MTSDQTAHDPPNDITDICATTSSHWLKLWTILLLLAAIGAAIARFLRPDSAGIFLYALALFVCLLTAGFDAATGRIPNQLTYTAGLLGLGLNIIPDLISRLAGINLAPIIGSAGIGQSLIGLALCAVLGLFCLGLAGMGGGDMKLIVALGAILGASQIGLVLLWALLIAVPYALVNLLVLGRLNAVLRDIAAQCLHVVYFRKLEVISPPSRTMIPLAVPIVIGLVCARVVPRQWLAQWIGLV